MNFVVKRSESLANDQLDDAQEMVKMKHLANTAAILLNLVDEAYDLLSYIRVYSRLSSCCRKDGNELAYTLSVQLASAGRLVRLE